MGENCEIRFGDTVNPCGNNLHFRPSICRKVVGFLNFRRVFGGDLANLPVNNTGNNSSFSPGNGDSGRIVHFYRDFVARLCERVNTSASIPTNSVNMNNERVNCLFNRCGEVIGRGSNILANGNLGCNNSLIHARTANCNLYCCARIVLGRRRASFGNGAIIVSNSNGITVCTYRGTARLNTGIVAVDSSGNCVVSGHNVSLTLIGRLGRIGEGEVGRCVGRRPRTRCRRNYDNI